MITINLIPDFTWYLHFEGLNVEVTLHIPVPGLCYTKMIDMSYYSIPPSADSIVENSSSPSRASVSRFKEESTTFWVLHLLLTSSPFKRSDNHAKALADPESASVS